MGPSPKTKRGRKKKVDLQQQLEDEQANENLEAPVVMNSEEISETLELNNEVFNTPTEKKTKKRGRKKKVEAADVPNEADENLLTAAGSNLNSVEDLGGGQSEQNNLAVEKKPTKRGRKKKSEPVEVVLPDDFESNVVVSFEATNNHGEGQKKANKRGRKKKEEVPIVEADDDVAVDDQGLEQSHISNSENIS